MQNLLELPKDDLGEIFIQTAFKVGMGDPAIIEKDYWVVRLLNFLYSDSDFFSHHVFKGGTSLSKCFGLIERFSEDCDITISKELLGFHESTEVVSELGNKKRKRYFDALDSAANVHVLEIRQLLSDKLSSQLQDSNWNLYIDQIDMQKVIFEYPQSLKSSMYPEGSYVKSKILLEFGCRGDLAPSITSKISTYVDSAFSDVFLKNEIMVHALTAQRTFWEKVTLLHMLAHQSDEKPLQTQMARHYYDVYKLSKSKALKSATEDLELLKLVAQHKSVYFKSKQASYETAKPGSLKLPAYLVAT